MYCSMLTLRLATVLLCICRISAFHSPQSNRPSVHQHQHHIKAETKSARSNVWSNAPLADKPSSSSALRAFPTPDFAVVGAGVAGFYKSSPLLAGFLTASTKAAFADSTAQYRDVSTTKFDPRRNLAMALYSGLVLGIMCEIMYNTVFPRMFGLEEGAKRALKMTLFDGFVNAPFLWLPPAYVVKAVVFRRSKREGIRKYVNDVRENGLLKKYWSLWLPMTMINFLFVPAHFRVAFTASVSFFWMIILSVVANNGK